MEEQDLSPWAHPKAQAWFKALLQRSQFGFMLEDLIKLPADQLDREQVRVILTFGVLLSRKEIWPDEHQVLLKMMLEKARGVAALLSKEQEGRPLSLREHRSNRAVTCEFQEEIEILRRRVGRSFKTSKLPTPRTWEPFWT